MPPLAAARHHRGRAVPRGAPAGLRASAIALSAVARNLTASAVALDNAPRGRALSDAQFVVAGLEPELVLAAADDQFLALELTDAVALSRLLGGSLDWLAGRVDPPARVHAFDPPGRADYPPRAHGRWRARERAAERRRVRAVVVAARHERPRAAQAGDRGRARRSAQPRLRRHLPMSMPRRAHVLDVGARLTGVGRSRDRDDRAPGARGPARRRARARASSRRTR